MTDSDALIYRIFAAVRADLNLPPFDPPAAPSDDRTDSELAEMGASAIRERRRER